MSHRPSFVSLRHVVRVGILAGATLAGCGAPPTMVRLLATPTTGNTAEVATQGTAPAAVLLPATTGAVPPTPTRLPTSVPATSTALEVTPTALDPALRRQVFDEVWTIVNDKYLYPNFNGLDWRAVGEEYRQRAEAATTNDEFYAELAEMIALLGDHHSRFLPPAAAAFEDTVSGGEEAAVGIGILVSFEQDSGYIRTVFANSPAALADIRPRDRILAVDGQPYTADDGDISGPEGTSVRLNVQRPGEKPRDVVLVRQDVVGRISPTYERLHGNIGYLAIPTLWVDDMDEQVSGALTELVVAGQMSGLIVDLRGNSGGWGHVLSGILGHFARGPVGTFFDQDHSRVLNATTPAGPDVRKVPLVVLIDGDTQSYAEVLAAVMQENGAQVVGRPSAGNTESVYVYSLRDGSRLWVAQENFKLRNGEDLEGHGVQPDSSVTADWKKFSQDDDPYILEALRLLGAGAK